jgi:hypothetical protein
MTKILTDHLSQLAITRTRKQPGAHQIAEIRLTAIDQPERLAEGLIEKPDPRRARKSSANRTWAILRAALNLAANSDKHDGLSADAWLKIKPFRKADKAPARKRTGEGKEQQLRAAPVTHYEGRMPTP